MGASPLSVNQTCLERSRKEGKKNLNSGEEKTKKDEEKIRDAWA